MKREIIRVEPYSTYLEQWKAPASIATRAGDMIYVSALLPFHPEHGLPKEKEPFEVQAVHCMDALKRVLEAADSDFDHILKCDILCTSPDYFVPFNEIYRGYFSGDEFPARIFSSFPVGRVRSTLKCSASPWRETNATYVVSGPACNACGRFFPLLPSDPGHASAADRGELCGDGNAARHFL